MTVTALRSLYQVKVLLTGCKPPIWRRLVVRSDTSLQAFHMLIQYSMGWQSCHLHQFRQNGVIYGSVSDSDFVDDLVNDEADYKLSDLLRHEKDSLQYDYDFGDGWEHKVTLEKILPFDSSAPVVQCIKGKRACPPEDCGGVWGYSDLLEIINDPKHEEFEEKMDWLGGGFDPEYFDAEEVNETLSSLYQKA